MKRIVGTKWFPEPMLILCQQDAHENLWNLNENVLHLGITSGSFMQLEEGFSLQLRDFDFKFKFKFIIWYIALRHPSDVASVLARTAYGEVKKIHST